MTVDDELFTWYHDWASGQLLKYSASREEKQTPIFEVFVNLLCHGTC